MGLILSVEQRSVCVLFMADVGIELACQVSTLKFNLMTYQVQGGLNLKSVLVADDVTEATYSCNMIPPQATSLHCAL